MAKYRKKPVEVEAMEYTGHNFAAVFRFIGDSAGHWGEDGIGFPNIPIRTLEGVMSASIGDYIIKGVNGEFYPCKPDIFEKTYERVEEE